MIIVAGEFMLAPGDVDSFLAGRAPNVTSSRAEKGNIDYTFAPDPATPGRVILFEKWEARADLDAHIAGMANRPAASGPTPLSSTITVYDATEAAPLR